MIRGIGGRRGNHGSLSRISGPTNCMYGTLPAPSVPPGR